MASQKQIDANRKNSELCCGPRTIAGKAVSSQNALKTGIDSKSEVMRCESRADHEQLIAEYYARFRPTLPEERALVDLLIKSEWLSRRYMSVECAIWERGFVDAKEIPSPASLKDRRSLLPRRSPHQLRPARFPEGAEATHGTPRQTQRRSRSPIHRAC